MKTVYIETSVPSFFFEKRTEPEMVARRNWTRLWWETYAQCYRLVTSDGVLAELNRGNYDAKDDTIALMKDIYTLQIEDDISNIIDVYIENHLMPRERLGDALHLALASYHKCDFLLTWNCTHIANANKFEHIRIINTRLGLFVPSLVTPIELCTEEQS